MVSASLILWKGYTHALFKKSGGGVRISDKTAPIKDCLFQLPADRHGNALHFLLSLKVYSINFLINIEFLMIMHR